MTKLEEKLQELGYESFNGTRLYIKSFLENENEIFIALTYERNEINIYKVFWQSSFYKQEQIDNLQQAFDIMQKDLEELKQYE